MKLVYFRENLYLRTMKIVIQNTELFIDLCGTYLTLLS